MSEVKKKFIPQWKPGTLCWYLREAGWFPVEVPDSFPRWMREGMKVAIPASEAWANTLKEIAQNENIGADQGGAAKG